MQKAVLCMKMLLLRYSAAVICAVFILTGAVSGEDVKKAVGETVSFRPAKLDPPVTSITWKQKTSDATVKAIEWDFEDGVAIPNPRFKDITTLDEKTGEITITNLRIEYSGVYTIDINSKEQGQQFSLEVMERVPKPKITIEKSGDPDVVYLRCAYSGTIIWKNSTGETLKGTKNHTPGEYITVKNTRNPENYYTCTLKNAVSEETSDPVNERELFVTDSAPWWIVFIVLFILILLLAAPLVLYKVCNPFHEYVSKNYREHSCIGGILKVLDGKKAPPENVEGNVDVNAEKVPLKSSSVPESNESGHYEDPNKAPLNSSSVPVNVESSDYVNEMKAPPENVEGNDYVNAEKAPVNSSSVPVNVESSRYEDPNKAPLKSSSDPENVESSDYVNEMKAPLKSSSDPENVEGNVDVNAEKEPPKADGDGGDEEARL